MSKSITDLLADWRDTREWLERTGWRTPQTYCNCFASLSDIPSVYLFACIEHEHYQKGFVGYVGMSTRLSQRIASHNVRPELERLNLFVMTWFKPTPKELLRSAERDLIQKFDPPWNISGRRRGVAA